MVLIVGVVAVVTPIFAQQRIITDPPQVRGPFTLTATYDSAARGNTFAYAGSTVPPVIRVVPGGVITLRYVNNLPTQSDEECATARCRNMTNLHFHGLHVSPERPQDDVLTTMAMPGESLDYKVVVPSYSAPGLYWYHTHPHGESARQDLDGMSGAIIVEGIDRYYPELRRMRERVIILRDRNIEHSDSATREQVARTVERATASYADEATQQFAALVKSSREDAARRLARELDRAVETFAREAEAVLAERLAHVGDAGAQRLERRLADAANSLERQRDEWMSGLDARIGELEHDVRRRLEELSADAEAERAVLEARLQELLRRIDATAAVQSS